MSIISKMLGVLGIHKKEDYMLAEYFSRRGCGLTSLIVKIGNFYYDINNHKFVDPICFTMSKKLNEYLDRDQILQDKTNLSTIKAKKIAKNQGYYKEFFEEWKEVYYKDKQLLVDPDYSFYTIL